MSADDAPGGWELKRDVTQMRVDIKDGFGGINLRFDELARTTVSINTYNEAIKRLDGRFADMAQDLVDERAARKEAIGALAAAMDKTAMWLRWIAGALILPILGPFFYFLMQR